MSLYGDVKKVGSSTFQFDRQYNNRVAMDEAAQNDGVYIGRYVLVEYGQRYNDTEGRAIDYNLISNQGAARLEGIVESESFRANAQADLRKYGATYDSTVWQKIYTENQEKYIMVAELNATTPRIEFVQEKPYLYRNAADGEEPSDDIYVGNFDNKGYLNNATKVEGAVEEFKKPYFDLGLDTELSYLLHLPTPVNLEVSNDTIDINEKGFNVAYSYGEKNKASNIKWIPQGVEVNDQNRLTEDTEVDTQKLYMNLTAFGDVMNTLYDLLYGKPEQGADLTEGALRPYFKQFRQKILAANMQRTRVPVMVRVDGELVPLKVILYRHTNTETETPILLGTEQNPVTIGQQVLVEENIPIAVAGSDDLVFDPDYDIYPMNADGESIISVCYKDGDIYKKYDKNSHTNVANRFFYDTRVTPITPLQYTIPDVSGDTDNLEWMYGIPNLNEILQNNTLGLASVLEHLFGYKDPFSGQVKYYLYNDWETKANEDVSDPCITNKPAIISGSIDEYIPLGEEAVYSNSLKYYKILDNKYVQFIGDQAKWNSEKNSLFLKNTIQSEGDYIVDYTTWELAPWA